MIRTHLARIAATTVAAGALGLAAVAGAGTAAAGTADYEFLSNLDAGGIVYPTDRAAISDGHLVCDMLADGQSGTDIGATIMGNSDLSADQAATLVVEAASAYCPGYFDQVVA
ncbi:DUF732 domain-containing protein [Mycolicibacterium sediminis]|uniref:DUF732 domain-containing protein n=1 Tax=Mycolicibacterium sediminis TaxID=1286180 RepID=A0A7I7QM13_9MYCO|nr:DUF732 domain-containing protein [Mycolicibacterium sediminis]BBY27322.1 hypothetical protein MSEDJ_14180 [Mycolicibacterium sediminis]